MARFYDSILAPKYRLWKLLLAVNIALIAIHCFVVALKYAGLMSRAEAAFFLISFEGTLGEVFRGLLLAALAVLSMALARSSRQPLDFYFALVFAAALIDNLFGLHDILAKQLRHSALFESTVFTDKIILKLAVFAGYGVFFASLGLVCYRLSHATARRRALWLLAGLALLILFTVIGDALQTPVHSMANQWSSRWWSGLIKLAIGLFEDAGEMLALSVLVSIVARQWYTVKPPQAGAPSL